MSNNKPTFRVAAAQINVGLDIKDNFNTILKFIKKAAQKEVDIVCFPEVSLNYKDDPCINPSNYINIIKKECMKNNIWCIFGSYMPFKNKVKNSIFLINRKGEEIYKYDKVHLWRDEKKSVVPGRRNKIIDTEFGKIGIIDCWDFAFSNYVEKLAKEGAKVIFCPSFLLSFKDDGAVLRKIPLVKAFENIAYYVSCDANTSETLSESFICHPQKILKSIKGKQGMIVSELDLKEIDKLRKTYDYLV